MDNKECTCRNLSILIDMVDLFDEIGGKNFKQSQPKTTRIQRDRATQLVDKLTNIIDKKDKRLYRLSPQSVNDMLKIVRKYRRDYEETGGPETVFAIDSMRALIHSDEGIRADLLCQKDYHSKENRLLYESMQALRGEGGTSEDSKRTIRSLYKDVTCTNIFGERG